MLDDDAPTHAKALGQTHQAAGAVICALVFGKADGSEFKYTQSMTDVAVANSMAIMSGAMAPIVPTLAPFFLRPIVHLCVSDENKEFLVRSPELIKLLTESLLLDDAHVRANQDPQTKAAIQQDAAECFLWLAQTETGRELLAAAPAVLDALHAMESDASTEEAKESAHGALMAVEGRTREPEPAQDDATGWVMVSYSWEVQATIERIVRGLQVRSYDVWFDLDRM